MKGVGGRERVRDDEKIMDDGEWMEQEIREGGREGMGKINKGKRTECIMKEGY